MAAATNRRSPKARRFGLATFRWLQRTFFSSWWNATLTILLAFIIYNAASAVLDWGILRATFAGQTRAACSPAGACWPFVSVHAGLFVYGHFPLTERWRVNVVFALL